MNDNSKDNIYTSSGIITLRIDKFSEFARAKLDTQRLSEPIYIRGLPWKILAIPREIGRRVYVGGHLQKCLGYFLQCNAENKERSWGCDASAIMKVLAQKEGAAEHARKIQHIFRAKENDWGYAQFMTFEALMDPESGWYDELTDSIILSVEFNADMPFGLALESRISEDLSNLFDKGEQFSDCTLVTSDGKEFKVYKGILACRSPVFAAMFEHEMVEQQNGIVQIVDVKSDVLEEMLRFIYSGKEPNLENVNVEELLFAADKYQLPRLKLLCERELANSLTEGNACAMLVVASQLSAEFLKAKAIKYIQMHTKEVTETDGWKMMVKGHHGELFDQIVKAIIAANN